MIFYMGSRMKNKERKKTGGFENVVNAGGHENLDTSIVDLTKSIIHVIQSGDVEDARKFICSPEFHAFLKKLKEVPEYLPVSYLYNCVAAYTSAMGVLSSFSGAEKLLNYLVHRKLQTAEEYIEEMEGTIVAFTEIVNIDRKQKDVTGPVRRACAYIQDHLYTRIILEELADYCGCSLSWLRHRFSKEMGMSLAIYIQKKKTERAKLMLRDPAYKIGEISAQLGFCSESYFISIFKKETGYTPKQYRISVLK